MEDTNRLIAEFMGYQECPMKLFRMDDNFQSVNILSEYQDEDEYLTIESGTRTVKFAPKDMEFSTSWDWLMPVVNKCKSFSLDNTYADRIDEALVESEIDFDYLLCTVLDFIKWYNENNND